jgi:hypothetical protein
VIGVRRIATESGIPVIEDAAQAAGGSLHDVRLGALGDVAILSFARGKGTTGAAGGAILVRTPELADWTKTARTELPIGSRGKVDVFTLAAQRVLSHPVLYTLPASVPWLKLGEMVYHPPRPPRAMSAASAAVLRWTLQLETQDVAGRRVRAADLLARVGGITGVAAIRPIPGGKPGFLRLALIDQTGSRTLRADLGAIRGYPITLDEHPQLQSILHIGERAGKGSNFLRDHLFTTPTHARVSPSDIVGIANWLNSSALSAPILAPAT